MGRDGGAGDGSSRHFAWMPVHIHEVAEGSGRCVRHERGWAWLRHVERRRGLVSASEGNAMVWQYRNARMRPRA